MMYSSQIVRLPTELRPNKVVWNANPFRIIRTDGNAAIFKDMYQNNEECREEQKSVSN